MGGRASLLPPEYDLRLHLMWENHFFQEDGIVQLALLSNRRGAMADPWDVTRSYRIPARTLHDLVAGLRLVGAHLTVAVRNLTGDRVPLTAGASGPGREIDLRLNWGFHY
jgi:outer membrane receptor protein involved in Fe transport